MTPRDDRWKEAQQAEIKYFEGMQRRRAEASLRSRQAKKANDLVDTSVIDYLIDRFEIRSELLKGTVLEVGCSPDGTIHGLPSHERVGIDPLAIAYSRWYEGNAQHAAAIGESIPFRDNAFDMVMCLNALDHMIDPRVALSEMNRVLSLHGVLILLVDVFSWPTEIRQLLGRVDKPHPVHFNDSEVKGLLVDSGFDIISQSSERLPLPCGLSSTHIGALKSVVKNWVATWVFGMRASSFTCVRKA